MAVKIELHRATGMRRLKQLDNGIACIDTYGLGVVVNLQSIRNWRWNADYKLGPVRCVEGDEGYLQPSKNIVRLTVQIRKEHGTGIGLIYEISFIGVYGLYRKINNGNVTI